MLLGQELKFKNKLCNLKLGTFFSALPGLGAFALSGRLAAIIWTYDTPFFLYAPGSPRYSKMVNTWRGGKYWLCSW